MNLAVCYRKGAVETVEEFSVRLQLECLSANCGELQAHKIFRQEIDGACGPGVAEALAEAVAVHVILLFHWCLGVELFPEGYRASFQHAAPVAAHFVQHELQISGLAKHIQFKEIEVRCGNRRNGIILNYILQNFLLLFCCCNMEQNCKNIGMASHISLAGFKGINKCALLLIPVEFTDLADQLLILLSVFRIFLTKCITYLRHCLPACGKQHLLCAKGTSLIHICPVNVDPVVLSSHKETVLIQLSLTELHKRAHFRVNLTHEFQISVHFIMIEHAQNPEQGIVHNGIDMSGHWIISAKRQKGSLVNIRICQQILVYEKALVSIAGPDPFVTLHAIQEKDSAAETEGMLCHIPDFVQLLIIALKGSTLRKIHILIECGNLHILSLAVRNKRETYCTARASLCHRIRLPAVIAMLQIKSLILRLSAINF